MGSCCSRSRNPRRIRLKNMCCAFEQTPIILKDIEGKATSQHGRLCGIGTAIPPEFENWFVEDVSPVSECEERFMLFLVVTICKK